MQINSHLVGMRLEIKKKNMGRVTVPPILTELVAMCTPHFKHSLQVKFQLFWEATLCHQASCVQCVEGLYCHRLKDLAFFLDCLTLEVQALWSFGVRNYLPNDKVSHTSRRLESSAVPLCEPQIWHHSYSDSIIMRDNATSWKAWGARWYVNSPLYLTYIQRAKCVVTFYDKLLHLCIIFHLCSQSLVNNVLAFGLHPSSKIIQIFVL